MGLFSKKKLSLEEILEGIRNLSDEEKETLRTQLQSAPVEEKTGKPAQEEPKAESETADENNEEVSAETASIDGNEEVVEETTKESEENVAPVEEKPEPTEEPADAAMDEQAQENYGEMVKALTERVNALEESFKGLSELKSLMEDFTQKQADTFGYKGAIPGAKKDIHDMSADELKASIIKGI